MAFLKTPSPVPSPSERAPRSRRDFLRGVGALAVTTVWPVKGVAALGERSPLNVLLIAVDDLNTRVHCYGDPVAQTPNLDRLASLGVRFDRAMCQYPLCNPSRVSLLTGLRPDTTQVTNNRIGVREALPDVVTLPQLFRENGYFTARVSKVFHDGLDDPLAWDAVRDTPFTPLEADGEEAAPGQRRPLIQTADGNDDDQPDGQTVLEAVRLMEEYRRLPLFLAVGLRKPHIPWVAPKRYFDLYDPERIPVPQPPPDDQADTPSAALIPRSLPRGFTDSQQQEALHAYYACVSFLDAQVGRLVECLRKLDLLERTVIVVFSDNGFHLGEHGLWGKRTLFEESARAPLIIVAPGARGRGRVCRRVVEFVDIYPTVADLCGIPAPEELEGLSLRTLLNDTKHRWKRPGFTQVVRALPSGEAAEKSPPRLITGRSVRTSRWRYTEWDEGKEGAELYDHAHDAHEYRNLAADPRYADTAKELQTLLHRGRAASLAVRDSRQRT